MTTDSFLYPEEDIIKRIIKDSKIENKEETFWRRLPDQPVSGVIKKRQFLLTTTVTSIHYSFS